MIDHLARGFLLFSNTLIILPVLIIGLIWLNRETFYQATCLLLFSMLVNVALKNTFQIPLSPALHKVGYAFPSGHMQLVTVLYGWLALRMKNYGLCAAVAVLLIGIACSLIHFGYHNIYDVLAAVICAFFLIGLYSFALGKWPKQLPWLLLVLASLLQTYIFLLSGEIAAYVWMAYYALCGLIVAKSIADKQTVVLVKTQQLSATLLCFLAIALINTAFGLGLKEAPAYIYQLQWFLIGFVIPSMKTKTMSSHPKHDVAN